MCRWLAYTGKPILLEDVLFKAKHSLIDQSMCSKSAETPTNGEIFEVEKLRRKLLFAIAPQC